MGGSRREGAGGPDSPRISQVALGLIKKTFPKKDFDFISLIHSFVFYVIKKYIHKTPVIIWPCHILASVI